MGMKSSFRSLKDRYVRFVEKQGFAIIAVVCVAIITGTAVWTDRRDAPYVAPTPPVSDDVSAAQLLQQTLREAATATPAPTQTPQPWRPPLDQAEVVRPYGTDSMVQSGVTGIWAVHDAVDLFASPGSKVYAMADGVVTASGEDQLLGVWLLIDHGNATEALYAGLALPAAYIAGDKVRCGDMIGFTGVGPLDETDIQPHLHLRVTENGRPINPLTLWNVSD